MSTSSAGQACTASRCSGTPRSAQIAAASATGWITPVRLLAQIRLQSEIAGLNRLLEGAHGHAPVGVDRERHDLAALTLQLLHRSAHGRVLERRRDDAAGASRRAAEDRDVVGLGSAAGEHDVGGCRRRARLRPARAPPRGRAVPRARPNAAPRRCRSARAGRAAWPPRPRPRRASWPRDRRRCARPELTQASVACARP